MTRKAKSHFKSLNSHRRVEFYINNLSALQKIQTETKQARSFKEKICLTAKVLMKSHELKAMTQLLSNSDLLILQRKYGFVAR